jgi:hypothetical protein
MSSGAIFNLISSTSQSDKLIYAQDYLNKRIKDFINNKSPIYTGQEAITIPDDSSYLTLDRDVLPSLTEIEKSHSVMFNSAYKPCIQVASAYQKVPFANPKFGTTLSLTLPQVGNFTTDSVIHVKISGLKAVSTLDRVRYVALPGHKLIENVKFLVNNGSIVDEYSTDDYNAFYQYEVPAHKREGYLRDIGQEIPYDAYLTADPTYDMFQEHRKVSNGYQTFKYEQDTMHLFIPILFWYRKYKNALANLPWGLIQIQITLCALNEIISYKDNGGGGAYIAPIIELCDLYVNQLTTSQNIFDLFYKKFVFSMIRIHRCHKQPIKTNPQAVLSTTSTKYRILLNNLKFPTEMVYFTFRPRLNLGLSQYWYKNCNLSPQSYRVPVIAVDPNTISTLSVISSTANSVTITVNPPPNIQLVQINNAYIGYDLVIISGTGFLSDLQQNKYTVTGYNYITSSFTINGSWNFTYPDTSTVIQIRSFRLGINFVNYYNESPVVQKAGFEASGNNLFDSHHTKFYNSYVVSKFENMNAPIDIGYYAMPFCAKNQHNPSGSIDFSELRELYLYFESNSISSVNPTDLIVLTKCINFILIDQGSLMLKYIT